MGTSGGASCVLLAGTSVAYWQGCCPAQAVHSVGVLVIQVKVTYGGQRACSCPAAGP